MRLHDCFCSSSASRRRRSSSSCRASSRVWEGIRAGISTAAREIRAEASPVDLEAVRGIYVPFLILMGEETTLPVILDGLDEFEGAFKDVRRATIPGQRNLPWDSHPRRSPSGGAHDIDGHFQERPAPRAPRFSQARPSRAGRRRRHADLAGEDHLQKQVVPGFSVDASVRVEGDDRAGVERLVRYCARGPLALERLHALGGQEALASPEAQLLYRLPEPDLQGRTALLRSPLELLELLERLAFDQSLPDSWED